MSERPDTVDVPGERVVIGSGRNEEITDGREDRHEALTAAGRAEFLHDVFALSKRQMAVLRAVVHTLVGDVLHWRAQLMPCGAVGAEFVGEQALRTDTLLAQQSGR